MGFDVISLVYLAAGIAVGALAAVGLQRRGDRVAHERADQLALELDETREELETHREQVSKHFEETSNLFRDLTEQYTRLYSHLAEGSREFCADEVSALGRGLDAPPLAAESPASPPAADDTTDSTEEPTNLRAATV